MGTLQTEAEKLLEKMRLAPPREPGEKLRPSDEVMILRLNDEGLSQEKIAEQVGCHQSTVSRTLSEYDDSRPAARKYLEARALDMTRRFVQDADPATILKMLAKLDVVREEAASAQLGVQIVLGGSDKPPVELVEAQALATTPPPER
jgi:transcriptional regulator with XRE-family HTH domain